MTQYSPVLGEPFTAGPEPGENSNPRKMRVTVILTSIAGTLAALQAATSLAKNLAAELVISVAEVVYFRYPLEQPPVPPCFFEKLCMVLLEESHLDAYAINVEIYFCRDQVLCFRQTLREQSLVVIGAESRLWFRRERKLASALRRLGHDVVLVYAASGAREACSRSVALRMLE